MKVTVDMAFKKLQQIQTEILSLRRYRSDNCEWQTEDSKKEEDRPSFDFGKNWAEIQAKFQQVLKIKHAINEFNTTHVVYGGMTMDQTLVYMAFLNDELRKLDLMRQQTDRKRLPIRGTTIAEYRFINYSLDEVKERYEAVENEIAEIQSAINRINVTQEIEI